MTGTTSMLVRAHIYPLSHTKCSMLTKHLASLTATLAFAATLNAQGTRLLRHPAVSKDLIAFEYAGDLWVVGRNGGSARRLTATPGVETDPRFSPDGSVIAYTGT